MPDSSSEIIQVENSDRALRRIPFGNPDFVIKEDGTPSSSNFALKKYPNGSIEEGLSVDIERLTTYEKSIQDITIYKLYALSVGLVRSIGLDCVHQPVPDNYAHALITGNIHRSVSRKLAKMSIGISYPS